MIKNYHVVIYEKETHDEGGYIFHKKCAECTKELNLDRVIKNNNLVPWKKNKNDWLMRNPDVIYLKNDKNFYSFEVYVEKTQEEIDKMLEGL